MMTGSTRRCFMLEAASESRTLIVRAASLDSFLRSQQPRVHSTRSPRAASSQRHQRCPVSWGACQKEATEKPSAQSSQAIAASKSSAALPRAGVSGCT